MEETPSLNIEDLYETKQRSDINRLNIFNKLLKKVHTRIKTASRQRNNNQFCTFVMPEILIGYPNYNIGECIAYIIDCLENDGFITRYVHPNLLFISWNHWVPQYVRDEIKKKTGINVDKYGKEIIKKDDMTNIMNLGNKPLEQSTKKMEIAIDNKKFKKKANNVDHFKPSGKFTYDEKFFNSMKKIL